MYGRAALTGLAAGVAAFMAALLASYLGAPVFLIVLCVCVSAAAVMVAGLLLG